MSSPRRLLAILLLMLLTSSMEASLLSSLFWWKERTPEPEPQPTFEEKVGGWLGETMMKSPERRVHLLVLPGGNFEKCGRSWGAATKCLPIQTENLFLLLAPSEGSTESRVIIPELEGLHFENTAVPLATILIDKLKREHSRTVVSGKMNEAGLSRLSQLAAVFQVKLRSYRIVPIFLGGYTDVKQVEQMLLPYLKEGNSVVVSMLPDGTAPSLQQMTQAMEGQGASVPSPLRIAADLSKELGLVCHETALSSPSDKSIDINEPNARILFCQEPLGKEPFVREEADSFITAFDGKVLLEFTRATLESHLYKRQAPSLPTFSKCYQEPYGCQIALLEGEKVLAQATSMPGEKPLSALLVVTAARFLRDDAKYKLTADELPKVRIRLDVLSVPQVMEFKSLQELVAKLPQGCGVLIDVQGKKAGFLPQVWKQVPDKQLFLQALCKRIGKTPQDLLAPDAKLSCFFVASFEEGE